MAGVDALLKMAELFEIEEEPVHCPYTNGPLCALMVKGWQPQELCSVLDCNELKAIDVSAK